MPKPLSIISGNDPAAVLLEFAKVLAGEKAVFVLPPAPSNDPKREPELPAQVADDIAVIVESSGSTGTPKQVEISLAALLHAAKAGQERLGPNGQWLLALPTNFVAGQQVLVRSLLADMAPVILNPLLPFTGEGFFRAATLMNGDYKYTSLVPLQLKRILEHAEKDEPARKLLSNFQAILVGGQRVSQSLVERAKLLGARVVESYGMTETAGGCIYDGVPLTGVELKIAPDGCLNIRGKTLANHQGDWLITNDLAELVDNKIVILGRSDRVIISGGLKISLDRVEEVALKINGVEELAAVSIKDQEFGERIGIAYKGSPEVKEELGNSLATDLGPAGRPAKIIRIEKLPLLATGKIDLLAVAEFFQEESN